MKVMMTLQVSNDKENIWVDSGGGLGLNVMCLELSIDEPLHDKLDGSIVSLKDEVSVSAK